MRKEKKGKRRRRIRTRNGAGDVDVACGETLQMAGTNGNAHSHGLMHPSAHTTTRPAVLLYLFQYGLLEIRAPVAVLQSFAGGTLVRL
jgi:hypothetical protein